MNRALFSIALLLATMPLFGQTSGSPDNTFGSSGTVTTDITPNSDGATDVVIQTDGKIVVAGQGSTGGVFTNVFLLARYKTDGSLDSSFGTNGTVTTSFTEGSANARAVALQTDGRILVVGDAHPLAGAYFNALARYKADGTPDSTFGTNGKVAKSVGVYCDLYDVAIQTDGKIVVVGSFQSTTGGTVFVGLQRYKTNGTLDSTFGINGTVTRGPGVDNRGFALALQSDGKIVIAGSTKLTSGGTNDFLTFRFKTNGTPDSTFGTLGRVSTSITSLDDAAQAVAIQSDGKIVVAGYGGSASTTVQWAVVRFSSSGAPDSTFGTNGIARPTLVGTGAGSNFLSDMILLTSGKFVLGGVAAPTTGTQDFMLVQLKSNGSIDSTFGNTANNGAFGEVFTDFGPGGNDAAQALAQQTDGKIVAVGSGGFFLFPLGARVALARYNHTDSPLPIQLASFTVEAIRANAALMWTTLTELNNYGFEIQRGLTSAGLLSLPNSFIPGHGTTNEPHSYSFIDSTITPGQWWYRLKQIDLDGTVSYSDPITFYTIASVDESGTPKEFALHQNYPNPFNPSTHIEYALPYASHVRLNVYNMLGQLVATLVDEQHPSGLFSVEWNGDGFNGNKVGSGVYFYRVEARLFEGQPSFTNVKRMLLLK
jgi:uncharacterized delta-60 repeat protein